MLKAEILMRLHLTNILPARAHPIPGGLILPGRRRLRLKVHHVIILILVRIAHQLPSFLGRTRFILSVPRQVQIAIII